MLAMKTIRRARGMSQRGLAAALGMADGAAYVSRIENGHVVPSVELAARIAQALGVSMDTLMGKPSEPEPDLLSPCTPAAGAGDIDGAGTNP